MLLVSDVPLRVCVRVLNICKCRLFPRLFSEAQVNLKMSKYVTIYISMFVTIIMLIMYNDY